MKKYDLIYVLTLAFIFCGLVSSCRILSLFERWIWATIALNIAGAEIFTMYLIYQENRKCLNNRAAHPKEK